MAKRSCRFEVRLTKEEYRNLMEKARRAGLSRGAFVRMSVAGQKIREAPSADVPVLIREMRRNGQYFEELLKYTESKGIPEAQELRAALNGNRELELMVTRAYGL